MCDNSALFSSHHQKHDLKLRKADELARSENATARERRSWNLEERNALKKEQKGERQRA